MGLHLWTRGGRWWVRGTVTMSDGAVLNLRRSLKLKVMPTNKPEALSRMRILEQEVTRNGLPRARKTPTSGVDPSRATVGDALRLYMSRRPVLSESRTKMASRLDASLGRVKLADLTKERLDQWAYHAPRCAALGKAPEPQSVAQRYSLLKTVLGEARKMPGWQVPVIDYPVLTKRGRKKRRATTAVQRLLLLDRIRTDDPEWWPFVMCLFWNGTRPVDMGRVKWRDVVEEDERLDEDGERVELAMVILRTRKGRDGEWRELDPIPLMPQTRAALGERGADNDYVFRWHSDGLPMVRQNAAEEMRPAVAKSCNVAIKKAAEKLGLPTDMSAYWGRHTFGTIFAKENGPELAATMLGHTNTNMVMNHYGHVFLKDKVKAALAHSRR